MTYTLYEFETDNEIERSWLISILSDCHFEGFEETDGSLKAYVPSGKVTGIEVKETLYDNELHHISFNTSELPDINWNDEWEKNFEPVVIAARVGIRAPFHEPLNSEIELVIEPKMSFGTGHHATTAAMVELMLKENFQDKSVLDFGSGTGVLAILAARLKAAKTIAIDNEEWAYKNCIENTERNSCVNIECVQGDDTYAFSQKFDIILANINRPVILKNITKWKSLMNKKGILIISGILLSDEKDILGEAARNNLTVKKIIRNNGWLAVSLSA
jgi:ribosomal protein L11 methyltransferase